MWVRTLGRAIPIIVAPTDLFCLIWERCRRTRQIVATANVARVACADGATISGNAVAVKNAQRHVRQRRRQGLKRPKHEPLFSARKGRPVRADGPGEVLGQKRNRNRHRGNVANPPTGYICSHISLGRVDKAIDARITN
jgi:hypothetical protein